MRLAKIDEYRRSFFTPDSAPSASTLRTQIKEGKLRGGVILGGRYYIDLDEIERQTNLTANLAARRAALEKCSDLEGLL